MDALFDSLLEVINASRTGKALLIISTVITLLTQLTKSRVLGNLMSNLPKGIRVLVPMALGLASAVVSNLIGGMNWTEALIAGLGGGYLAVSNYEVLAKPAAKMIAKK